MPRFAAWLAVVFGLLLIGGGGFWVGRLTATPGTTADDATDRLADETPTTDQSALLVYSEPDGVRIWLDGEDSGKTTPAAFEGIGTGTHRVRLESATTYTWTVDVEVKAGETARVTAVLVPREAADVAPLQLVSSAPADGGTVGAVPPSLAAYEIILTFDRPLMPATVVKEAFDVQELSTGRSLLSAVSYQPGSAQVTLRVAPGSLISPAGHYRVTVLTELTGAAGELLPEAVSFEFGEPAAGVSGSTTNIGSLLDQVKEGLAGNLSEAARRDVQRKADLGEVREAVELYAADQGAYPELGETGDLIEIRDALVPFYLLQLPGDPTEGDETMTGYRYRSDGSDFRLETTLEAPAEGEQTIYAITAD
jgi:hypothetical protein